MLDSESERPFLKPIKFQSEELPQPLSEEVDPDGRACCSGVSGIQRFFPADLELEDEASNQLEEIDSADPGRIRAEIDAVAAVNQHADPRTLPKDAMEGIYCADLAMVRAPINAAGPTAKPQAPSRKHVVEETFTGVYNIKDSTRLSSSVGVNAQQMTPSRSLPTGEARETVPQEPTEALDQSADGTFAEVPDVLVVEEESPSSSSGSVDPSVATPSASVTPAAPQIPAEVSLVPSHLHPNPKPPAADSCLPDALLTDNSPQLFVIDTEHTRPFIKRLASDVILVDRTGSGEMLAEEDELIVYVVPHPRSGSTSSVPEIPRVKLPTTLLLTGRSTTFTTGVSSPMQEGEDDVHCVPNRVASSQAQTETLRRPGQLSSSALELSSPGIAEQPRTRPERSAHSPTPPTSQGCSAFGSFGAMLSEAQLREEGQRERRHPRVEPRRRGDSDMDWGTDGEGDGRGDEVVDEVSSGLGGMDLDPDVELGMDAMKGFLTSMSVEGSRFVTMDDIHDEARMRREDGEDQSGPTGSSDSDPSDEDKDEDREEHEENEEEAFNKSY
ncbi:hypothetical protein BU15DRAFT_79182 [Melanogaster broomeanus]|nr:hypothetical protein BU15DRAFT_79182 [Melanogaster broomeanus]